jgi:hypothetical protein
MVMLLRASISHSRRAVRVVHSPRVVGSRASGTPPVSFPRMLPAAADFWVV